MTESAGRSRTILYLHGFASSPRGMKAQALASLFEARGVSLIAPDLNVPDFESLSFRAMSDVAARASTEASPDVIVGSSLGAMVALDLVRRGVRVPLVLLAPALGFGDRWRDRVPEDAATVEVHHYGYGERRRIGREFFDEMSRLDLDAVAPPVPVILVMGSEDESVPWESVQSVWSAWSPSLVDGSEMITVDGGDHGLTGNLPDITAAITRALELRDRSRNG